MQLVEYPKGLPFTAEVEQIREVITNNQVVIVCGETGSGKTTQLPKLLYSLGLCESGQIIGHTQPRRVAAKTVAKRIEEELKFQGLVGYKVRFHDRTHSTNKIKLMTDGILLQEIQTDRWLAKYSALIIDEAHERSLNIDFILGYLKSLLPRRKDLKVIITSATIDNERFSRFFNNAPIVNISGKMYPVDIIYQPLIAEDENEPVSLKHAIYLAISSCLSLELGNILVFLPGEREIKDCITYLRKTSLRVHELLPLFSRQNEQEQDKIFYQDGKLKIILTTNVAETSLTIPGIRYVIDSGLARVRRYNSRYKVEQLQLEDIAKANCKQRAGRAGRVSHGMCIRLFTEADYNLRAEYTDPEILRSNLANVILRLIGSRLGNPETFPFIERPAEKLFQDGFKTLYQLNALAENNKITEIGKKLALIPIDVNLSRILIAAGEKFACITEALIIVSFLTVVDPREYIQDLQQVVRERQKLWCDKQSEFILILNLWEWYQNELKHKKSRKKFIEQCQYHFLSVNRLKEWHELHSQLKEIVHNLGYHENSTPATYQQIHQAVLTGLLNNVGQKDLVDSFYLGVNNKKFIIHPASEVNKPKWVVSALMMQTTKLYARMCAMIEPEWLVPITKHLVRYTYADELWNKKRGEAVVKRTSLFSGLAIESKFVACALINPALARDIMIRNGLVLGELVKSYDFIRHNDNVIKQIEQLEDKLRVSLVLIEEELYKFYAEVLPLDICDILSLEKWLLTHTNKLKLDAKKFVNSLVDETDNVTLYPDMLENVKLSYVFEHGRIDDGVTAEISLEQLNQLELAEFSWLVPGLIRDKVTYIIKALPKAIRTKLNPINDAVTDFLEHADNSKDFTRELYNYLVVIRKINLTHQEIGNIELPTYLIFHFKVLDHGKVIAVGDDLLAIKQHLAKDIRAVVSSLSHEFQHNITDINDWHSEMFKLLEPVELVRKKKTITGVWGLQVKDGIVSLTILDSMDSAITNTRRGIFALVKYKLTYFTKHLSQKKLAGFNNIAISLKDVYTPEQLLQDSINFILKMSVDLTVLPQNKEEFDILVAKARANFALNTTEYSRTITTIGKLYNQIKLATLNHTLKECILLQLDDLIYPGFLKYTSPENLLNFPRYLQAILIRLTRYDKKPQPDSNLNNEVELLYNEWYNYVDKLEQKGKIIPAFVYDFKFKLEELRVSLFAQELKTPYPVSSKRLGRELTEMMQTVF